MKNKLSDVRNHLVAMLESLADPEVNAEVIERAKVTAQVAGVYIAGIKVEVDACRVAADLGYIPAAIDAPRKVNEVSGGSGQVLTFEHPKARSVG
jgi:hypothetical protein